MSDSRPSVEELIAATKKVIALDDLTMVRHRRKLTRVIAIPFRFYDLPLYSFCEILPKPQQ
jgi:hypothetical protein